jgi:carbamoyltransferase
MKILGISLGHDTNFSLIQDGTVIEVCEVERFYRQKRYKLHAFEDKSEIISGFQIVKIEDLLETLLHIKNSWGGTYDFIAVQNQGRVKEFKVLKKLLNDLNFNFKLIENYAHHICHASSAYFTSPFRDSLILSFDGAGNDGQTLLFHAKGNKIRYKKNFQIKFGQSYNNLGYIVGLKPDIAGSTAGKLMGLTSYGDLREDWIKYAREYIINYKKIYPKIKLNKLNNYGQNHIINSKSLSKINELNKSFLKKDIISKILGKLNIINNPIKLNGDKDKVAQDLAKTIQHAWSNEVIKIIKESSSISKNFCIVGGCALNGITNYKIEKQNIFNKIHYIPNPTDCGLSIGAGLLSYYKNSNLDFQGYKGYFSPYLGSYAFDIKNINEYKNNYSFIEIDKKNLHTKIARAIQQDAIIGVIRGRYEIGPRALGNRSILCNPLNLKMRQILNEKVKKREWYRPFAPVSTVEEARTYFTNDNDIPYMSVICEVKSEFKRKIPAVTHIDGSARLQTVSESSNEFLWKTINEFKKFTGYPILLNTSFNPGGEPILNYCHVGLSMLDNTELDFVLIDNIIFSKKNYDDKIKKYFNEDYKS